MWKIDSDGDAQNSDNNEVVTVSPSFTVKHWRIIRNRYGKPEWDVKPLYTFDSEAAAREFLRVFTSVQNAREPRL